ncbi:uncharacterized protein [Dermacentor andersoni]|uniref:uncharacterized protein isoform X2 n=1 Tax=Dermacentor andersoni TaxID=34620 RepID=UPI002418046B|nr:uncharacterized protein LOC126519316 isoform X2 [Dermacentor andersoni]
MLCPPIAKSRNGFCTFFFFCFSCHRGAKHCERQWPRFAPRLCFCSVVPCSAMPCCCAFGCSARPSNGKRLFRIPSAKRDAALRKAWLEGIRRADFNPTQWSRLCEDHFTDDQFEAIVLERYGVKKLRRDAVPTIFCYDKNAQISSIKVLAKRRIRMTKNSCFYKPSWKKTPPEAPQKSEGQPSKSMVHISVNEVLPSQEALPMSVETSGKYWLSSSSNQSLAPTGCQQAARADTMQLVQEKNVAAVSHSNKDCAGVEIGHRQGVAEKPKAHSSDLVLATTLCSSMANRRHTVGAVESYSFSAWPGEDAECATAVGGHDHEAIPMTAEGAPEVFVSRLIPVDIENRTCQEGREEHASSSTLCQSSACSNVQSEPQHDMGQGEYAPAHLPLASVNDTVEDGNRQRSTAVKATVVAASNSVAGLRPIRPKQGLAGDIQKASGSTGAGTVNWLESGAVQTVVATSPDGGTVQQFIQAGLCDGQQCEAAQEKNVRVLKDGLEGHQTSMQNVACIGLDGRHQSSFIGSVRDVNVRQSETGAAGPSDLTSSIQISSVYTLVGDRHQHAASAGERVQGLINGPVNLQRGVAKSTARLTVGSPEARAEPIHMTADALACMLDRRPLTSEEDLWDRIDDLEEKLLRAQKRLAVVRAQRRRVLVENRALRMQVRRLLRRKTYHPRRLHTSAGFSS